MKKCLDGENKIQVKREHEIILVMIYENNQIHQKISKEIGGQKKIKNLIKYYKITKNEVKKHKKQYNKKIHSIK